MNAWKQLPVEILEHVFNIVAVRSDYTNQNGLRQRQLTCKNWSEVAQAR
jgi:hypothetical protein